MGQMPDDKKAVDVRTANEQFYQAFEKRDLDAMDRVWKHSSEVRCVHPGWDVLVGWNHVRGGFERIFRGVEGFRIALGDITVHQSGSLAVVTLTEHLMGQTTSGSFDAMISATNVFEVSRDGAWRLIHHHGSPIIRSEIAGAARAPMVH